MMAVVLENVPNNNIVARTTIFSVYCTAQIIASLPNVSYHKKVNFVAVYTEHILHASDSYLTPGQLA